MELGELAGIGEALPVAVVEIGLAGQALGEEHVVAVELDVEVADLLHLLLHDRGAVDEAADRHQHAVDEHGVARRQPHLPRRNARREGARQTRTGWTSHGRAWRLVPVSVRPIT